MSAGARVNAARAPSAPPRDSGPSVDCDALLCALVLAPSTYSRNRFFQLYQDAEVRSVRRRASILRGLVRQFVKSAIEPLIVVLEEGYFEVTLKAPGLGFERHTRMGELELALFRYMHAKSLGRAADTERVRIEGALARLVQPIPAR